MAGRPRGVEKRRVHAIRIEPKIFMRLEEDFGGLTNAFETMYEHFYFSCKSATKLLEKVKAEKE